MEHKKSAVDLTDLAVGIVILGVVVSIGSTILLNVRDASLTDLTTLTTTNETFVGSDTTATNLDSQWFKSLTSLVNLTNNAAVPAGNYTLTETSTGVGQILVIDPLNQGWNGFTLNATYDYYDTSEPSWDVADKAATGLAEYGNWFDIIVIVGVAAVILALIFMAFGKDRGSDSLSQAY